MPGITGMELLSMIDEEIMPIVVFVTAYDEYALKAFEESAFDYLLKPVEKQRLVKTTLKIQKRLGERHSNEFIAPEDKENPLRRPQPYQVD